LVDECQRYSKLIEGPSFLRHGTDKTISGVCVSPGSTESLVRRGGIKNNRLIATFMPKITKIG